VRDAHPLFSRQRVTDAVLVRSLSTYQQLLLGKALLRDRSYMQQQASIVFAAESASGAATGAFPAAVANDGTVSRERQPTGYLKELETDSAVILVAEFVPSSVTTTSLTKTSAGWTTNAYQNQYLEVTAGTGLDQRRVITSNAADTLNFAALTTPLDATSVVRVISVASSVPEDLSVVTAMPAADSRTGYLIKLDSAGVAYIDPTDPIVATFDRGIPLPPHKHLVGGTVRLADTISTTTQDICPLTLTSYASRYDALGDYTAYVANRQLFLVGDATDWSDVQSIDLRYVPDPASLTALTDYFLLPDHAEPALIAQGAFIAAQRVQGLEGMAAPDLALLSAERDRAESAYLSEVASIARGMQQRIQEVW